MPTLEDTKQYLPPIVCDIADIIGFPATENLIKAIGGTSFSFGQGIRDTPFCGYCMARLDSLIHTNCWPCWAVKSNTYRGAIKHLN